MNKFLFLTAYIIFYCVIYSQENIIKPTKNTKLLVYYFHMTHRCNTCIEIEKRTKEVLEENFPNQIKSKEIIFQTFNCELPKNQELVKEYNAYGSTLALTIVKSKQKINIDDLTSWAFSKIGNINLFKKELKEKIEEYLKL
ncbi:MAG: nitrophenyl compound nitroreductase subunit ArsF family protein [Bacteroidales bacterium]|nr:nitrophenyl compound nitroreductase subunit ArsF family protein [Bacteroidales bacterium]